MPDKNLVEIVTIVDRSGSMQSVKDEAISGFNDFLKEQRELPGRANFTLVTFNTEYDVVCDGDDIQDVEAFTDKTYVPAGFTALLDAVARGIDDVGNRLSETPEEERPWRVIFCILTDGKENASKEYTLEQVRHKIHHQEEAYDWKFQFLAAGLEAFVGAQDIGLGHVAQAFSHDAIGTRQLYAAASSYTTSMRYSDGDTSEWTEDHEPLKQS